MNNEKIYNCNDCLYANLIEDGKVECDKRLMERGRTTIVEEDKVELNCPAHSGYPIEEWRYGRGFGLLRDAEDSCDVCARLVNLLDKNQYDFVDIEGEDGDIATAMKCRICIEKGR